ncbi:MAG: response regulator [Anaerolineales bacterium]|nr:response regulator [Anaerolineales bacterium]
MTTAHVLVIDDEPGIAKLCERLLKRYGYHVVSFSDPHQALEYVEQNAIDLLLVDIRMPEISGFDMITRTRQHQPESAVLVMTGFGTVEMAIQALRQGVDGLILKPFEAGEELVQAVEQALRDSQKKRDVARMQALRPLFDITQSLLAETRPDRLLDLVLHAVSGHLHCEQTGFYQFDEAEADLRLVSSRGKPLATEKDDPGHGIIARADEEGVPLWVNAAGPGEPQLQKMLAAQALASVMVAPITPMNVRSVLYAARAAAEIPFREADWEMFLLLSRQTAIAMENARLYAELRDYVQRVEDSQQALVRAEKMATAGRLTASIAHEINNPLQAVQNCLHLAMREGMSPEKQQEYLTLARTELDRLMKTVQRMLDFYRPGGVDPQPTDVADLMRHVIDLLSPQIKGREIRVTTGFSSKLPRVLAVSSQLQQVFINLILNAYDAMPEGGELRITARLVKDMIEIIFQDSGPGVLMENRSKIFEPFVSTKEGGTGLGLSVSYGIVAAHGGSLDLVHGRGPGACFRIVLPVKDEKGS